MITEYILSDPASTLSELAAHCNRAIENNITHIAVAPLLVKPAKELLSHTNIQVSVPIGYPFGWNAIEAKLSEIILAMVDGANELDLYINLTALKNNDWQYLAKELNMALTIIRKQQKKINIVLDAFLLTEDELTKCCDLYGVAGIDCLTISTGLNPLPDENTVQSIRTQLADTVPLRMISTENIAVSPLIVRHALSVK